MIVQDFKNIYLTQVQVAELFNISRTAIHTVVKKGKVILTEKKVGAVTRKFFDWRSIQQLLEVFPHKRKTLKKKSVKFFGNLKGGTGKSTVACQYSMLTSSVGIKTLHIDLDPQAHSTLALTRKRFKPNETATILNCIKDDEPLDNVKVQITPFLDIIPAHLGLTTGEVALFNDHKRAERMKRFLKKVGNLYDQIIFDTSPSAGLLSINALVAATEIIVVTETEYYSVEGLSTFFKLINSLKKDFEITKDVKIIPNFHCLNHRDSEEALAFLRTSKKYGPKTTTAAIRENADLKEAHKRGIPIWLYKNKSQGSVDIKELCNELIQ